MPGTKLKTKSRMPETADSFVSQELKFSPGESPGLFSERTRKLPRWLNIPNGGQNQMDIYGRLPLIEPDFGLFGPLRAERT